ncbi:MAG: hypothetical protein ACKVP0_27870 [Pirellulaceae bacterium]
MKTGQMLFVAVGGMLLGAGGTLAIQTGLVNYEVSLDIRPRHSMTVPPPALEARALDPYTGPHIGQTWEPEPPSVENLPLTMPPLDDQQVAEIVSLREQIGSSVSQKLTDLTGNQEAGTGEAFAEHLRAAAGTSDATVSKPESAVGPLLPAAESSLARGLRESYLR